MFFLCLLFFEILLDMSNFWSPFLSVIYRVTLAGKETPRHTVCIHRLTMERLKMSFPLLTLLLSSFPLILLPPLSFPYLAFFPCSFLSPLSPHSAQISIQHIIWGPERFHIQRLSQPECHLRGPSLHLVPPAGPLRPANVDPPGTLAQGEGSDGPGGLAKPSGFWGRRWLAPIHTAAHAGRDTGGAPVCIYPWGGWGWVVSCRPVVPRPAHQWIFGFGKTFPEPCRTQRICSHRPQEVLLWLLHWPAGEAGRRYGLYFWPLYCRRWEVWGVQEWSLDRIGGWSAQWRCSPGSDIF